MPASVEREHRVAPCRRRLASSNITVSLSKRRRGWPARKTFGAELILRVERAGLCGVPWRRAAWTSSPSPEASASRRSTRAMSSSITDAWGMTSSMSSARGSASALKTSLGPASIGSGLADRALSGVVLSSSRDA